MEARRFDKKRWKKRKVGEGEGKLLENCGQIANWRKMSKEERGEKERREGWEAQRAVGLLHDTANVV